MESPEIEPEIDIVVEEATSPSRENTDMELVSSNTITW